MIYNIISSKTIALHIVSKKKRNKFKFWNLKLKKKIIKQK